MGESERGRVAERERQPPTDIGTNCVKNVWRCRWRQLRAQSREKGGAFWVRLLQGLGGRPTSKTFVWYPLHFYVFAQSSHLPHTHFTCLAPSAETLTPNEKRQQIIHHFAFRLGSISSGKSYATQLGYCSSWRWPPPAPIVPFPTPEHSPVGVGGKNIIWNGLSSILCAIFLLFPFLFIFFSSTFFFACLRFAFSLLYPRRPRLL